MTDEDPASMPVESVVRQATEDYSRLRLLEALNRLTSRSRERPSNVLREIALELKAHRETLETMLLIERLNAPRGGTPVLRELDALLRRKNRPSPLEPLDEFARRRP